MTKIPKVIHYCWFGGNPIPQEIKKNIENWKRICPDYLIIQWDESNFDINLNVFVKQAYNQRKWAFVTDYVRLYVLYHHGGIYLDTDVEIVKNFDDFLNHSAFTGCESDFSCVTGTLGASKGNVWIEKLLEDYENSNLLNDDGSIKLIPNTKLITEKTINDFGWEKKNIYQILKDDIHIYPFDFFCAKNYSDGKIYCTENTVTIHHFSGSWLTPKQKVKKTIGKLAGPLIRNFYRKIKYRG